MDALYTERKNEQFALRLPERLKADMQEKSGDGWNFFEYGHHSKIGS